jgi:cobalt-precorrin-5B (C1)-methyltransferase
MAKDVTVPPRDRRGLRTGYTTGACSAAAAKAATRYLVSGVMPEEIETTLPNGQRVIFPLKRCERVGTHVVCSVIKDAGDDPDCTHGAELVAEVELTEEPSIELRGGEGVAHVTKPGLGLEVGGPAINPVPRQNITDMVAEELREGLYKGAIVTISVPGGEEMAKQTINARLGLIGGISILGTTGIVKPYSTAAFKTSVIQSIDVAIAQGVRELVLTTGGRSETYAMRLYPQFSEAAFIQMGDFVGVAIKHCARRDIDRAIIVGMIGKLSKMANGKMQTHAAGSEVNMDLLADLVAELGADENFQEQIRASNTARHVLELCKAAGYGEITTLVCRRAVEHCVQHAGGKLPVQAYLMDFEGGLLGQWPGAEHPRETKA